MNIRQAAISLISAGAIMVAALPASPTMAGSISASFTSRIFYQNPNNAVANAVINFYPEASGTADPVSVPVSNIPAFGSGEVWLGSVNLNGGGSFKGSAVLSADQNIVAAVAQISTDTSVAQIFSTAFGSSDAATTLFLPTFLYNLGFAYSTFSVQNTDADTANYRASFYAVGNPTAIAVATGSIPANSDKIFDANISTTIGTQFINYINGAGAGTFSGSVVVTATLGSSSNPAHLVGVTQELYSSNNRGYAFGAISQSAGSTTVYIPTALCNSGGASTFFAVQNMGSSTVDYTVRYFNTLGQNVITQTVTSVAGGSKKSFNPCQATTPPNSTFAGSAVVTGASIAAVIGKAQDATNFTTAYEGQGSGSAKLAIPFVKWGFSTGDLRAFIAVQNVGSALSSGQITLTYYNTDGSVFRTCTSNSATPQVTKVNTNPGQGATGATMNCTGSAPVSNWSGSVIVSAPSGSLIAISRSQAVSAPQITGDINAVFIP